MSLPGRGGWQPQRGQTKSLPGIVTSSSTQGQGLPVRHRLERCQPDHHRLGLTENDPIIAGPFNVLVTLKDDQRR